MTVESATYISDLNASYPASGDAKAEGDNHLRLIKSVLKSNFPALSGPITSSHTEIDAAVNAAYSQGVSFRNKLINGDFSVWQRGTSFALTTAGEYTADRFCAYQATTADGAVSQQATSYDGHKYCLRIGRNSSATSTGAVVLVSALESVNSIPLQGGNVTLSFYARAGANYSSSGSALSARIHSGTGTDQSPLVAWTGTATVVSETKTLTTSWQRFSVTGAFPSSGTQIQAYFTYTPVGTAGAADYFEITGIQLESGSVATPFEHRPYSVELAMCRRYLPAYTVSNTEATPAIVNITSTSGGYALIPFDVPARVAPTSISLSAVGDFNLNVLGVTNSECTAITFNSSTSIYAGAIAVAGTGTPYTVNQVGFLRADSTTAKILFDGCEL